MTRSIVEDSLAPWILDVSAEKSASALGTLSELGETIRCILDDSGVVLIRGLAEFTDVGTDLREALWLTTGLEPLPYFEQSSPRSGMGSGVFTASHYPHHANLFLHNELSYAATWPRLLAFYCAKPADEGGATTLADCRQVLEELPEELVSEFATKSWSYVRNLRGSVGLDWPTVFQTTSRAEVEAYCEEGGIELEWFDGGACVRAVRPAMLHVPEIGRHVWFNHIAAFHTSTLPETVRQSLRKSYSDEELPVNTYFGNGDKIPDGVVESIRDAYDRVTVDVHWRAGDLVFLDNRRVAHGRRPFTGVRNVYVVLAGEDRR